MHRDGLVFGVALRAWVIQLEHFRSPAADSSLCHCDDKLPGPARSRPVLTCASDRLTECISDWFRAHRWRTPTLVAPRVLTAPVKHTAVVASRSLPPRLGGASAPSERPITGRKFAGTTCLTVETNSSVERTEQPQSHPPHIRHAEQNRQAATPAKAKSMGRSREHPIRSDWQQVKDDVMRTAVRRKFETHARLREQLLATGDEELVENAPNDYYWGRGRSGTGKNMLGRILMEVRKELRPWRLTRSRVHRRPQTMSQFRCALPRRVPICKNPRSWLPGESMLIPVPATRRTSLVAPHLCSCDDSSR